MITECKNCVLQRNFECPQYLGEAVGWRWLTRTDDSWKDCYKNYLAKKESD